MFFDLVERASIGLFGASHLLNHISVHISCHCQRYFTEIF